MHDFFDENIKKNPTVVKMKAISLKQPWANLVIQGKKIVETRVWRTNYRGDLVICSSKKPDYAHVHPTITREPMGYALGVVELYDIIRMNKSHEKDAMCQLYENAQAWLIRNIREFIKPIPVNGQLNIFNIELPINEVKFK